MKSVRNLRQREKQKMPKRYNKINKIQTESFGEGIRVNKKLLFELYQKLLNQKIFSLVQKKNVPTKVSNQRWLVLRLSRQESKQLD